MIPSRETKYFKIGIFVIIGLALITIGIMTLSSGRFFKKTIILETYFSESIQGLSKGSPVKYRGVEIGHVDEICFVHQMYKTLLTDATSPYSRYVYVEMIISPNLFINSYSKDLKETIAKDVKQGLRIKLALQGLTGNAYLELNFENPKKCHPLTVDWTPKNYYIPSTISTLTQFSDSIMYLLDEIKKVKLQKLFNNVKDLAGTTNNVMLKVDNLLARTGQQLKDTVDNADILTENLRTFSERIKEHPSQLVFGKAPPKLDPNKL